MTTYDVHAHAIMPDALSEMAAAYPDYAPSRFTEDGAFYLSYPGRARLGPMPPGMFDPDIRLAEMKEQRVDVQVVAIAPPNYHYHVPAEVGTAFATIQNDHLFALSEAHPDNFHVFATLPMQDVAASVEELARIADQPRLRGVQLGTNIDGVELDDDRFEDVWSALESHDLSVWMHGDQRSLGGVERLNRYYLQNFIGQPLESTIAMGRLIFGGVLERHARLRFGWVHGGGFLPYQIGRWDHGWGCRSEARVAIDSTPPSEYFRRMYFDTLTHDPLSLELLGRRVGWDHVMVGSDYPFDMASKDPVGGVEAVATLTDAERAQVLQHTAEAFLRPLRRS